MKAAIVAAVSLTASVLSGLPAAAQTAPTPSYATGEESIRGRIVSFDGKYALQLRDDRGFVDNVNLHDGTIINPTGLRLATGQSVAILGHNSGKTFEANEIDTPYADYGGPRYAYGYPAYGYYGYGYPYRGYGYGYRAYPSFGVGFRERGFGVRGWF